MTHYNEEIYFCYRKVLRPTVVSTVLLTERDTSTVRQTVSHTIFTGPGTFNEPPPIQTSSARDLVNQQRQIFSSNQDELVNLSLQLSDDSLSRQIRELLDDIRQDFNAASFQPLFAQHNSNVAILQRQDDVRAQLNEHLASQRAFGLPNPEAHHFSLQSSQRGHAY